ncbi:F-box domain-containing protein [Cordyceps javanica]|uniref:F-box domain-containing protein n=1 Tax=Cordyceps javanica TaxID=43265 RepID=A0A545V9R7_9HYPO|nr:F-box domain-containing protein [Cordyceps javanica]TQW09678.1 F-box domain protein [Cordyceps javanica]
MSPATLAVKPMHPPAFETIPELAPVLEYASGGANTTDNYNSPTFSFPESKPLSLSLSLSSSSSSHTKSPKRVESISLGRRISRRLSAGSSSSSTSSSSSITLARSQLPPLNTTLPIPIAAYPMYSGLQTAPSNTGGMPNTTTTVTTAMSRRGQHETRSLNRPRKISASYERTGSSASARSPYEAHQQRRYQQQQQYHQQQQQYIAPYQSPTSGSPVSLMPRIEQRLSPEPDELFGTLPGEVLEVVLEWLKELHLDPESTSCATCWARDLCSLSLASRKWSEVARLSLYQDVHIIGEDSAAHRKRFKLAQGCRMTLLRRTLRANGRLAATVRSLRVPAPVGESRDAATTRSKALGGLSPKEAYENRVAALVMACPNLEVLAGPVATYNHNTFSRITHALSTRKNLKTMNWHIEASEPAAASYSGGGRTGSSHDLARPGSASRGAAALASSMLPPPPLNAAQETTFLGHHRGWASLASLSVHCQPGASLAPATLLQRALTCLPALQHLHLSRVPADAFGDATLLSLPPLRSLTLAHTPGVTAAGLSAFATRPNSHGLRSLQLRHAPLTSLPALARLLSHLPSLASLALVQDFAPLMPSDGDAFALWMMPYLASRTLVRLHWDIVARHGHGHGRGVSDADDILARSIEAGGFPALRTLRAPSDPDGIFQQLCRPLEAIATSADRIWANGGRCGSSHGRAASISSSSLVSPTLSGFGGGFGGLPKSATAASLPTGSSFAAPLPHGTDLRAARIAAQARLDDARPRFRFQVKVLSEEGLLVDDFGLGGYVGTVGSPIDYWLRPDVGSCDERGGLVDVPDLASPGGEALVDDDYYDDDNSANSASNGASVTGCTGGWNWREGVVVADRKEKERWWHTERGRWVRPRLDY